MEKSLVATWWEYNSPEESWLWCPKLFMKQHSPQLCKEVRMQGLHWRRQESNPRSLLSLIKDLIELRIIHATDPQNSHWSKPSSTTKNFGSIGEGRGRMPGQEIVNTNYNRIPNINDNTSYEDRRSLYIHFSKVGAESQTVWTAQFLFTNVLSFLSLLSRTNQWQVWEKCNQWQYRDNQQTFYLLLWDIHHRLGINVSSWIKYSV